MLLGGEGWSEGLEIWFGLGPGGALELRSRFHERGQDFRFARGGPAAGHGLTGARGDGCGLLPCTRSSARKVMAHNLN